LMLVLIPALLWMLKRNAVPNRSVSGVGRIISSTFLGTGQRLVTLEVGEGESKRWLLLGVTPHHISLLQELPAKDLPPPQPLPNFASLLKRQGKP
jgi:flagellar protein FliO/FliZ